MHPSVTFRPTTPADREFLLQVYASTRVDELAIVPWSAQEKAEFLRMQFVAQDQAYHADYPAEAFQVILLGGVAAGRLYLHRADDEFHLIDVALLPEHRGQGIGTALLRTILAEATAARLPVRLYVEHFNPARRLYQRLGFTEVEEHGPYWRLEWSPLASGSASP